MKNYLKLIVILCVTSMVIYSCSHEAGEDIPTNTNEGTLTYASAQEFLADNAPKPEVLSLDATTGGLLTTKNGITFMFGPNSFSLNNAAVTGNVDIEILEVSTPMDMMLTGATTSSSTFALESGGMFKIEAKQNGQDLQLTNGARYQVTIPAPTGLDGQMRVFQGVEEENIVRWEERDSNFWRTDSSQKGYVLDLDFLKWCNLDKYMDQPNQTKVRVKLPDGYTNTNTSVFMVFKTNMVTPLFGDKVNEEFNTGSYTAPIDMDVKFVVIAVKDKKMYYAIVDSKLVKDHLETINNLTEVSEDDLKKILEGLKP